MRIFSDYIEQHKNKKPLKIQKGLSGCSGLFCPNIYLYGHHTVQEKQNGFDNDKGPFAMGKIVQVPNHQKLIENYVIEYDDVHKELDGWMYQLPKNDFVIQCLKQGIERANKFNWRLVKKTRNQRKKTKKANNTTEDTVVIGNTGTTNLSGILEENNSTPLADEESSYHTNNETKDNNINANVTDENASTDSSDSSSSDDGSNGGEESGSSVNNEMVNE